MSFTSEIYLSKKQVTQEEWFSLIYSISKYNGLLKKWKIIVINNNNQIRFFVKTNCSLPATINNLNAFLLKPIKRVKTPNYDYTGIAFPKGNTIVDLINYHEIRKNGTIKYLEITIQPLYKDKIHTNVVYYLYKGNIKKRCKLFGTDPTSLLSIDFEANKRFFYKSSPKYLEIKKVLHLLNSDSNNALLSIDTFPYLQGNFYLNQNEFSFDKHSLIIGSSGCGKSKFISLLVKNIRKNKNLNQNYKVIVIDPHASLENDIGGMGRVIDFKNNQDSIDLFINNSDDVVSSTELLLDLFKTLIADQFNSKLERVLRHSINILLTAKAFNFTNLRKLLLELEYRNDLIKKLNDELPASVIDFFLSDFNELKTRSYGEAVSPIVSFIDEMAMIPVFNGEQTTENLSNTIHENFLTVFSLDRTKLGDKVTKTIAGLIMQQLLTIVQQHYIREHVIFIIDEVAVVENPILSRYLSEARKYNLSLILAGQFFDQITPELKNSIFANVVNYFAFRVSKLDANILVDNFNMKIPLDDSREAKIKLLTELNNRECIARIDSRGILIPAFKGTTLDYVSIPRVKRTIDNDNNVSPKPQAEKKTLFSLDSNVKLKDILISTSSSRKVVKK